MSDRSWWRRMARLVARVEKTFGRGMLTPATELATCAKSPRSTGLLELDELLGGGLPCGRIVEIAGTAGSGKSSLALALAIAVQGNDGVVAWIDIERALVAGHAAAQGVDLPSLLVARPRCAEQALELVETLARSGDVALVVLDSLAALIPEAELDSPLGVDSGPLQARLLSRALRRIAHAADEGGTTVVLVNQLRERHGAGETQDAPAGGHALGYYASVRLALRVDQPLMHDGLRVGDLVGVEVRKSRDVGPGGTMRLPLHYATGFARRSGSARIDDANEQRTLPAGEIGLAAA